LDFFNIYVGNNDSHAKNLSIHERSGEVLPGKMGKAQLQRLAVQIGMGPRYLQSMALFLAAKVPLAIDKATKDIYPDLTKNGQTFAEKLAMRVKAMTRQSAHRFEA
jgi:serine/threonine-protein kinase HipA